MKKALKTSLNKDHPGVADVRRWRAKVFKQAGGTLEGLIKLMRDTPPPSANPAMPKRAGRSRAAAKRRAATPRLRKGRS